MGWLKILGQMEKAESSGVNGYRGRPILLSLSWRTKLGFLGLWLGSFGIEKGVREHAVNSSFSSCGVNLERVWHWHRLLLTEAVEFRRKEEVLSYTTYQLSEVWWHLSLQISELSGTPVPHPFPGVTVLKDRTLKPECSLLKPHRSTFSSLLS